MRKILKIAWLMTIPFFIFAFPTASPAVDTEPGRIGGKVLNKTVNEKGVEGLEVTLEGYIDKERAAVYHTKTDQTGSFSFEGLNADPNMLYYAVTEYQGVKYFSPAVHFQGDRTLFLDFTVYETTDRDDEIYIKMHHILLERAKDHFEIREVMVVENRGKRTYLGPLRISLPEESSHFQSANPFIVKTKDGFSDTSDIKPGVRTLMFSYQVHPDGSNYTLKKEIHLKTESLDFIFPDSGIEAKSNQLELKEHLENGERRFFRLSGKDFSKGSGITVDLNLPLKTTETVFKGIIIALAILLVGAGFSLPHIRRRKIETEKKA